MKSRNSILKKPSADQTFHGLHQKLVELREEKKAIIEKSGDAIFVVQPFSGEIFEANNRAEAITGYPVSELQKMNFEQLVPDQEILAKTLDFYSLNGNGGLKAILSKQDGTSIPVKVSAYSIQRDQKSLRLVFVRKPSQDDSVRAKSAQHSKTSDTDSSEPIYEFPNIIGKSEKIRKICHRISEVTSTDCTVLVQGESGTGKEVVAQVIHYYSGRSKGPFVKVNCAALSETLLESELFGHVKGAFTGAIQDRKGRFMQANKGTILLDEIGCMSPAGQAKLLRVLEEREFEPVGSSVTTSVDVRVIAASKMNLKKAVEKGEFREDLYYRLNVFSIFMPPLREKKEDIPLLAQHFLRIYALTVGKEIQALAPESLELMMQYDWPGNVRELKNAIEHAVIVAKGPVLLPSNLPSNLVMPGKTSDPNTSGVGSKPTISDDIVKNEADLPEELSLREKLNICEKRFVQEALKRAKGVKKEAASILQIDPRNFSYLLRKHGLLVMILYSFIEELGLLDKV
jgi:PAS domain S-box-containing protein